MSTATLENSPRTPEPPAVGVPPLATGSAPRFFWKQCYEIDEEEVHWALCDTESEKDGKCSCAYMVLLADYPNAIDGKPVGEQDMPALIARLLTEHYAKERK